MARKKQDIVARGCLPEQGFTSRFHIEQLEQLPRMRRPDEQALRAQHAIKR